MWVPGRTSVSLKTGFFDVVAQLFVQLRLAAAVGMGLPEQAGDDVAFLIDDKDVASDEIRFDANDIIVIISIGTWLNDSYSLILLLIPFELFEAGTKVLELGLFPRSRLGK